MEADQLKLLGRSVAPVDVAVADAGATGLKIWVEDAQAVQSVANILEDARAAAQRSARGPVQMCLLDPALPGEVEIDLGNEFPVNPQIKGALKSLPGIMDVEEI